MPVSLKAGQAVLYNNNLIHRGYTETMKVPRRTLHMGYHSAIYPPTWHFYLLDDKLLTPDYIESLNPTMKGMVTEYLACREKYPDMEDTWKWSFNFPSESAIDKSIQRNAIIHYWVFLDASQCRMPGACPVFGGRLGLSRWYGWPGKIF